MKSYLEIDLSFLEFKFGMHFLNILKLLLR